MAKKLLIVHGYSDGRTSFTALGEFLIKQGVYLSEDVFYLNYSSMDDEATFQDFADKLDADYRARFGGERIDVICHSTGSLVVRAWLALHAARAQRRAMRKEVTCPVDRFVCLAPANFGSFASFNAARPMPSGVAYWEAGKSRNASRSVPSPLAFQRKSNSAVIDSGAPCGRAGKAMLLI